jgi:antitoxin VapB
MATARVFKSGNSQAVRLPKQFRVKSKELEIERRGNELVLREKPTGMQEALDILDSLPKGLGLSPRRDSKPQKRKGL